MKSETEEKRVCDAISRSVLAATQCANRLPAPAGNSPPLQGEVSRKPLAVYETEGLYLTTGNSPPSVKNSHPDVFEFTWHFVTTGEENFA